MLRVVPDESLQATPDAVVRRDLPEDRAREAQKSEADASFFGDVDCVVVERVRRVGDGHEGVHEAVARVAERRDAEEQRRRPQPLRPPFPFRSIKIVMC